MPTPLTNKEIQKINERIKEPPAQVALSLKPAPDLRPQVVATQIDCLQRLKEKVPTWYKTKGLYIPSSLNAQQCSSEPIARFRQLCTPKNGTLLDLTGGLGVDCFFMSEFREKTIYVEQNEQLFNATKYNFQLLGRQNIDFINDSAEHFLQNFHDHVSTIFIDPSRRSTSGSRVFQLEDCSPNILALKDCMLDKADEVIIKLSSLLDIHKTINQLCNVTEVFVLGTKGECKDLMLRLSKDADILIEQPLIHAISVNNNGFPDFDIAFTYDEEQVVGTLCKEIPISYAEEISQGMFLYDPSPMIMKAACFNTVAQYLCLSQIAPASHLYISSQNIPSFPGRKFLIKNVLDLSKPSLKSLKSLAPNASIAVRNFPLSADALRKKLSLGESDNTFLFATTLRNNKSALILCQRM